MKDKILCCLFMSFLFGFALVTWFIEDKEISRFERRRLTTTRDLEKNFIDNLDEYLSDQFPLRNEFISINSLYERDVLKNSLKNGVYVKDGYIFEEDGALNEKNVVDFSEKMNYIKNNYLKDNRAYYTIVPNKSHFLEDSYQKVHFDDVMNILESKMTIDYIDISESIELEDYYKTDIHLKQQAYFGILNKLNDAFANENYKRSYERRVYQPFYGASYSKVSVWGKPDVLEYFVDDSIKKAEVNHLEYGEKEVYDVSKLGEMDSYDVFLSGSSAIVEIKSSEKRGKNLIIFRDSFASSLAPLLISFYDKITLVDLRYIDMSLVGEYVDFTECDVLFMYSTNLVNKSYLLKVLKE